MLRVFRSRLLAYVLMALTVIGTSGAWHVADDPDCATPAAHDHSAHHERFSSGSAREIPTHCAICHWLQGFRTDAPPDTRIVRGAGGHAAVVASRPPRVQQLARLSVPSRAPPA